MRIASRVVGVVLALTGLAFVALAILAVLAGFFDRRSVLDGTGPSLQGWEASGFAAAIGVGLIVFARYYFRMDAEGEDSPTAPSRAGLCVAAHRRKLAALAQAGFVLSLAYLAAVSVGIDWPGRWAGWILAWLAVALIFVCAQGIGQPDWNAVPEPGQPVVKTLFRAGQVAFFILAIRFAWNQWRHQLSGPVLESGLTTLLFGWAAMTFAYGQTKVPQNEAETQ
jgi:hypothetical protein